MPFLQVADQKVCYVVAHLLCHWVERLEGTSLLRDVAFHYTYYLVGIYLYILFADAVADVEDRDRLAEWALCYLIDIVEITRGWAVEGVLLDEYLLGETNDGRDDATG